MATSRVIILGVAAVAALGAGYIAKNLTASPPQEAVVDHAPAPAVALTDVLVLGDDVPVGATIQDQLKWQAWPSADLNENFITRDKEPDALEKAKGSLARVAMYAGEPLRRSKLVGGGHSFLSSVLPAGMRAVATQISANTSAGGFVLPNDYVDVIMTRRNQSGSQAGDGFITETILKNIRVLAIDQTVQEDEQGQKVKVGETATLELTPQQAEIITVAQQMAEKLALSLRSIADATEKPTDQADYLVTGSGRRGTVKMIRSGEVTEVGANK